MRASARAPLPSRSRGGVEASSSSAAPPVVAQTNTRGDRVVARAKVKARRGEQGKSRDASAEREAAAARPPSGKKSTSGGFARPSSSSSSAAAAPPPPHQPKNQSVGKLQQQRAAQAAAAAEAEEDAALLGDDSLPIYRAYLRRTFKAPRFVSPSLRVAALSAGERAAEAAAAAAVDAAVGSAAATTTPSPPPFSPTPLVRVVARAALMPGELLASASGPLLYVEGEFLAGDDDGAPPPPPPPTARGDLTDAALEALAAGPPGAPGAMGAGARCALAVLDRALCGGGGGGGEGGGADGTAAPLTLPSFPPASSSSAAQAAAADAELSEEMAVAVDADPATHPVTFGALDPRRWNSALAARARLGSSGRVSPADLSETGGFLPPPPPRRRLAALMARGAFADDFHDPGASQLRRETPGPFAGLWPELALLRHSCAPNVSVVPLRGGRLFLHAARTVDAGQEATFGARLGREVGAPLSVRARRSRELFGGGRPCGCARCAAEAALPAALRRRIEALHWAAAAADAAATADGAAAEDEAEAAYGLSPAPAPGEWTARHDAALADGDAEALRDLADEVDAALEELEDALTAVLGGGGGGADDAASRSSSHAAASAAASAAAQATGVPALDLLAAGAFDAYDLSWRLEDLLSAAEAAQDPASRAGERGDEADADAARKLRRAVDLAAVLAPGGEAHVALAARLDEMGEASASRVLSEAAARAAASRKGAGGGKKGLALGGGAGGVLDRRAARRADAARERAEEATLAWYGAAFARYGVVSAEGMLPALRRGQALFYEGLARMAAEEDEEDEEEEEEGGLGRAAAAMAAAAAAAGVESFSLGDVPDSGGSEEGEGQLVELELPALLPPPPEGRSIGEVGGIPVVVFDSVRGGGKAGGGGKGGGGARFADGRGLRIEAVEVAAASGRGRQDDDDGDLELLEDDD